MACSSRPYYTYHNENSSVHELWKCINKANYHRINSENFSFSNSIEEILTAFQEFSVVSAYKKDYVSCALLTITKTIL